MENQNAKKPLPFSVTKQQLERMFYPMPSKKVKQRLKLIADDYQKTNPKFIYSTQAQEVPNPIFIEFVQTYGCPAGYIDTTNN